MLLLALDTATDIGLLTLVEDGVPLVEWALEAPGSYLSRLLPALAAAFTAAGRKPADLAAVGVSVGPGNFTGLRIGCAIAKTLAWSLNCPLVPVPTMEVLAAQLPSQPQPIGVLLDAKRQEVFWGLYCCPKEWPEALADPVRLPLAELGPRLTLPLILTGFVDTLPPDLPEGVALAPPECRRPQAATLARLAQIRLAAGRTSPPTQLTPIYLRPPL